MATPHRNTDGTLVVPLELPAIMLRFSTFTGRHNQTISIPLESKLHHLRKYLEDWYGFSYKMKIFFDGKALTNEDKLLFQDYGLIDGSEIFLIGVIG